MESLYTAAFWGRLLEIGFLNLVLSGDNAVVIALAVRSLPKRERLLGQIWGTVGAVALRLLFLVVVSAMLRIPLLRLGGAVLLIWIAVRLVQPGEAGVRESRHGASLREAIWIIIMADVTMSLDNVLAIAAAARGEMLLIGIGIASSLPLVVLGSALLAQLMNRHAWIVWVGGGILGYVAGDMVLGDPIVATRLGGAARSLEYALPLGLAAVLTGFGWWSARRHRRAHRAGADGRSGVHRDTGRAKGHGG